MGLEFGGQVSCFDICFLLLFYFSFCFFPFFLLLGLRRDVPWAFEDGISHSDKLGNNA